MSKMCDAFQAECADLQQGLKAMGLQGISNKGMLAAMVTYENTLRDISWQVSGNGKAQTNVSLKAATIALGDKVTSVHQVLKEINKVGIEHNKGLMEQLSSLELAIKNLNLPSGPAVFPSGGFDAMPAFVPPKPCIRCKTKHSLTNCKSKCQHVCIHVHLQNHSQDIERSMFTQPVNIVQVHQSQRQRLTKEPRRKRTGHRYGNTEKTSKQTN